MEKIRFAAGFDITNPKECLAAVKKDGYSIRYIHNPDKEIQLVAVKQYSTNIECIRDPNKEVQLETVKYNGYNIRYIQNPDKDVQMAAIEQSGYDIKIIMMCPNWEEFAEEIERNMIIKDIIE